MRIAVLADIHGNAFALEAVLADVDAIGVDAVVNLGDSLSGPIDAARTADLLMARDIISIRGNHDRYLIEQDPTQMGPTDRVTFEALAPNHLDWLSQMPPTRNAFDDVFLCHGTPESDSTYWLERVTEDGMVRPATLGEVIAEANGVKASLILCAHTHIPRCVRLPDGRTVVNPGSVGCPGYDDDTPVYHVMQTGSPNASYAIVDRFGGGWRTTFRSIPYDANKASALALQNGRAGWARALATGWFVPIS